MKTILQKAVAVCLVAIPSMFYSQIDLTVGLNYQYNPPSGCNNQITGLTVDICNNGSGAAGSFLVGAYLYDPSSTNYWVVDVTTINSLSGNACVTINNWNINMNQYPSLPAPGSNYRLGIWVDTANAITETSKNNNSSLLSGNIQVCAGSTGLKTIDKTITGLNLMPNPTNGNSTLHIKLSEPETVNVDVIDITGKKVLEVVNGKLDSGDQKISLPTNSLNNGIYFVIVNTSTGTTQRKLIVQK
ncbi:MAG: T9SS type A sorting domain-containing protein [Bacteroidia bacterium]